jgi:steroid delta-isomerase-like uncharacterized protein
MSNVDSHKQAHQTMSIEGAEPTATGYFASDIVYTDAARGLTMKGREEAQGWLQEWKTMASDARIGDPSYLDAGEWTIARFQARGTHDGPLGDLPATGKLLDMPLCELLRWRDGKAVEGALYYDSTTLMVQLGHMDAPAAP